MDKNVLVTPMLANHWTEIKAIYAEGISSRMATFETELPSWEHWDNNHSKNSRFIGIINKEIIGWAALSPVSHRKVYHGIQEVSIYIKKSAWGKGFGRQLLSHLVSSSEKNGIWTLQAVTFPENLASIKLHTSCGFKIVGHREKIAKLDGIWRNTVLMERRSPHHG